MSRIFSLETFNTVVMPMERKNFYDKELGEHLVPHNNLVIPGAETLAAISGILKNSTQETIEIGNISFKRKELLTIAGFVESLVIRDFLFKCSDEGYHNGHLEWMKNILTRTVGKFVLNKKRKSGVHCLCGFCGALTKSELFAGKNAEDIENQVQDWVEHVSGGKNLEKPEVVRLDQERAHEHNASGILINFSEKIGYHPDANERVRTDSALINISFPVNLLKEYLENKNYTQSEIKSVLDTYFDLTVRFMVKNILTNPNTNLLAKSFSEKGIDIVTLDKTSTTESNFWIQRIEDTIIEEFQRNNLEFSPSSVPNVYKHNFESKEILRLENSQKFIISAILALIGYRVFKTARQKRN